MDAISAAEKVDAERDALLGLFTSLLRPLMPLALEKGISAREVSEAVRKAYVQTLESRMAGQDRKLSDARLALVSGLTRSEVALFRSANRSVNVSDAGSAERLAQVAALLSVWHTHPKFSGAYGLALDLDLVEIPDSPRRTFLELVDVVCPGHDQESVLDLLIAADAVEILDRTAVRCKSRVMDIAKSDGVSVLAIDRAAKCLESAARTFSFNLQQRVSGKGYFERMVTSDYPLSSKTRDEFERIAEVRGDEYVVELDTWLSKHSQIDPAPANGKRYGVGVYFFEEAETERQSGASDGANLATSENAWKQKRNIEEIDVLAPLSSVKVLNEKSGN